MYALIRIFSLDIIRKGQMNHSIDRREAGYICKYSTFPVFLRLIPVVVITIFSIHQGNSSKKPDSNLS